MEDKSYQDVETSHSVFSNNPVSTLAQLFFYAHVYMVNFGNIITCEMRELSPSFLKLLLGIFGENSQS